jgi:pilus assembly protein Flp/PilA
MGPLLGAFLRNEEGATAIEYGLIAALIAVLTIGAMTLTGGSLQALFGAVTNRATNIWDNANMG